MDHRGSSQSRVTLPLNLCELAIGYIDLEGTILADGAGPIVPYNGIMAWSQGNSKSPLIVGLKGCHHAISLLHNKGYLRERR